VITARLAYTATPIRRPAFNKRLREQVVLQTKNAAAITACPPGSAVSEPISHAISQSWFIWSVASGYSEVTQSNARTALVTHNNPGVIGTLWLLFRIHGRQRENEREKRLQYWREQVKKILSYTTKRAIRTDTYHHLPERFPPKYLADARNSSGFHILTPREFIQSSFAAIWHRNGRLSCSNIAI